MERRFFSATRIEGDECTLTGDEAHHLARVLRAAVGDEVTLFDNSGREFLAQVSAMDRQQVRLKILSAQQTDRELPLDLHLGIALPKGDRQKWLIEKIVELGVTRLTPLMSQYGVAQPTAEALERLRRQVIEASKQCARNRLMEIHAPHRMDDFCRAAPVHATRLITHPYQSVPLKKLLPIVDSLNLSRQLIVAIGPEGGWSEVEMVQAIDAGWTPVSLGKRILRVETAACAVAAIVSATYDELTSNH